MPFTPSGRETVSLSSVRRYRILFISLLLIKVFMRASPLPFGFVTPSGRALRSAPGQCIPHGKPPCHLLILTGTTPCIRDLHPLEKMHTRCLSSPKFICIFKLFQELTTSWAQAKQTHLLTYICNLNFTDYKHIN
jgi:hypothetical protein